MWGAAMLGLLLLLAVYHLLEGLNDLEALGRVEPFDAVDVTNAFDDAVNSAIVVVPSEFFTKGVYLVTLLLCACVSTLVGALAARVSLDAVLHVLQDAGEGVDLPLGPP